MNAENITKFIIHVYITLTFILVTIYIFLLRPIRKTYIHIYIRIGMYRHSTCYSSVVYPAPVNTSIN